MNHVLKERPFMSSDALKIFRHRSIDRYCKICTVVKVIVKNSIFSLWNYDEKIKITNFIKLLEQASIKFIILFKT